MIAFLKKYKAFVIGLLIVASTILFLDYIDCIKIPNDAYLEVFLISTFWWLVVSLPLHHWRYLKRHKITLYKIGGLLLLFFITMFIDSTMSMPDNPITFIFLMLFWIGIVYFLVPFFILKYWKLIAFVYSPLLVYFLYIRLFSGGLEDYLKIKDEIPFVFFFMPIPIFFALWTFEQWKWLKNLKADKSKAELSLLRTQINPHFFFNTLNNLYALTIKKSDQAPELILKLSDMMRYTIYEGEKERVTLKGEIDYLQNYIELHKIRHKKTVECYFKHDIDQTITIAPLLFIILLENAFKHGIETLTEDAYIRVSLSNDDDFIYFSIENNFADKEINETKGIGLTNLKHRLALLYPKNHELVITQQNNVYKATLKITRHV